MSENPNPPGYGESESAPLPASDFPADLFDGVEGDEQPVAIDSVEPAEASAYRVEAPATTGKSTHNPVFPVLVGVAFLALMVVGAILNLEQPKSSVAAAAPATTPETPAAKEAPDPTKALATSVDALKSEMTALSKQLKDLQSHVETTSKDEIHPLQGKIEALAKSTHTLASLPAKVAALDGRLTDVNGRVASVDKAVTSGIGSVRQELLALKGDVKRVGQAAEDAAKLAAAKPAASAAPATATPATTTPATATPAAEPAVVDEDQSVAKLAGFYKSARYKEAADAFHNDEKSSPKDARAWYYAALSQGSATNVWTGEAERLVKKGVEREKAGTPKTSAIDTEFASLPATVKPWLDYYRKDGK